MRLTARALLLWGALATVAWLSWVASRPRSTPPEPSAAPASERAAARAEPAAEALREVLTLAARESSAYHAGLCAAEDDAVLVTEAGFTVFRAGGGAQEHQVPLGPVTACWRGGVVFWRSGRLREVALVGGAERDLVALPRQPRHLLTAEGHVAWVHADRAGGTTLQTLAAGEVRTVYEGAHAVSAPVLHAGDVYWVVPAGGSWTIGRVALDGRRPTSSAAHRGRPPAMLVSGLDGVYFYDGPERGVRRLSFDLGRETAVLQGSVCSPLAVSERVACARVGGLFEVPAPGAAPRWLAFERAGPITALALTPSRVLWVADGGRERLLVRSVALLEL